MNARDALISKIGNRYECRQCQTIWYAPETEHHSTVCHVPALLAQFDKMQAVCDAAWQYWNDGSTVSGHQMSDALDKLTELDKLNQKDK